MNQDTIPQAPVQEELTDDRGEKLTSRTVVFELQICKPSFSRRLKTGEVDDTLDADMYHFTKDLIDRKALSEINSLDNWMRQWVRRRAVNTTMLRGGLQMMPVAMIEAVDDTVAKYAERRKELVAKLADRWDELKEEARVKLGDRHFREQDYAAAEQVAAAFQTKARWWVFDVPQALKNLDRALYERESARLKAEMSTAFDEVRDGLRAMLADLLDHLVERLGQNPDGSKRIFRDTAVENLTEFLNLFDGRNVTDDDEMAGLVDKCKKVLGGREPDSIRKAEDVREYVRGGLADVKAKLDTMVTTRRRAFALDAEEV